MAVPKIYENSTAEEQSSLDAMRLWITSIESLNQTVTVAGKLNLIRDQLNQRLVTSSDSWKLAALGLLFGDALYQTFEGRLRWVMVEDEQGLSPALRWMSTDYLVFPISTVRSRVQAGEALDIHALFTEYSDMFPFQKR